MNWRKLPISLSELCIDTTLRCGQSFRWKKSSEGDIYSCAFNGRLYSLFQDQANLHYRVISAGQSARDAPLTPKSEGASTPRSTRGAGIDADEAEAFLRHYLNLGPNLGALYEQWSTADQNFKKKAPRFTGVRILKQDVWEALVGFICSSNNNIARISQMMDKLCIHYGSLVGHVDDKPFYDMPPPSALIGSKVEGHLRELGFGYRARYLHQTAVRISQEQEDWLNSLRNPESPVLGQEQSNAGEMLPGGREGYRQAHEQLLELQGVGPKVADCVSLMGLGWGEAVPVDTHVWQIAQRDYKFGKGKHRSLTKATYDAVADHFRTLWGKEAGWAHSVLFTADLKTFSERLTARLEIKEEVKNEDGDTKPPHVKAEATVKVEVGPALPPSDDRNGDQKLIIKSERIVVVKEDQNGAGSSKVAIERATQSQDEQTSIRERVISELPEMMDSIERDGSIKREERPPIKQESLTPRATRRGTGLKSESRVIKKESLTPVRIKSERASTRNTALRSEPRSIKMESHSPSTIKSDRAGTLSKVEHGQLKIEDESSKALNMGSSEMKDDLSIALTSAANSIANREIVSALGAKRESAGIKRESEEIDTEDGRRPARRASKRQRKR